MARSKGPAELKQTADPVCLITGAGRGIGRAAAEAFAARGYTVVVAERLRSLGRQCERALLRAGGRALFLPTDVASPRSIERTVVAVRQRFGRLDCLVNNAGVLTPGSFGDLSVGDVRRMLSVNLEGPVLMTRAVLPILLRQGSGSIINIASQLGKVGMAGYVTYCASKFGVVGFTKALADELAGTGVRVWVVCPGQVDTQMARQAGVVSARERARLIRPEAVARVVVNLATGQTRAAGGTAVDVLR